MTTGARKPTLMARETRQAPDVVATLLQQNAAVCQRLAQRFAARPPRLIATCARGSSDNAATYAKYLLELSLGIPVMSAAPSIGSVYARALALDETLFVVVSQSGQSPDLVANAAWASRNGAFVVAVVNDADSPVAAAADEILPLHAGVEASVAATKTCIASLAALAQLAAHLCDSASLHEALTTLPGQLARALTLDWHAAVEPLASAEDLLVIGRGLGFGIANEAALKLKETAAIHAEAFSGAELMHGPVALVKERFPLLVFTQNDETRPGLERLIDTLRDKGARVFAVQEGEPAPFRLPVVAGMHAATAPLAMIETFYLVADAVARARGLDPDQPPHLRKVTETR